MRRRVVVAVVGGGQATVPPGSTAYGLAGRVGDLIARRGGILLCGGGSGVMEAAARSAHAVSRRTIGVMKEAAGSARPHLGLTLWTGLRDGRNYINAAAADAMIALHGEAGTLSEIALALKLGRPVICLGAWQFLVDARFPVTYLEDVAPAVDAALEVAGADAHGFIDAAIGYPPVPGQEVQREAYAGAVARWSAAGRDPA